MSSHPFTPTSVRQHFDQIAGVYDAYKQRNSWYISTVKSAVAKIVPKNLVLLEYGCGTGDVLAYLQPRIGVGYDVSSSMIELARRKYAKRKELTFTSTLKIPQLGYDYIVMTDVIEHIAEPEVDFRWIRQHMDSNTHLVMTYVSSSWEWILAPIEAVGGKMPEGPHRRIVTSKLIADMEKWGYTLEHTTRAWPLFPVTILVFKRT